MRPVSSGHTTRMEDSANNIVLVKPDPDSADLTSDLSDDLSRSSNNNDPKKIKLSTPTNPPSRVVHIRNIPSDVSETEIVHLGIPFGRVSNVLVLKGKNQAFLELADEPAALAMVTYFNSCAAQLRGRSVYVQFSTHKELKTDGSHSNANSAAQAALAAAQALVCSGGNGGMGSNGQSSALSTNSSSASLDCGTSGGANTVLRVIVESMLYPVTLDVLHSIFSRVGKVLRIVTFTKSGFFQALIQYPDVVAAQAAKLTLDSQNIYNGCCTLRIEYSKLASLNVRYNNDKSRDYTNPNLPTGEPSTGGTGLVDPYALAGFGGGAGNGVGQFGLGGGGNGIGQNGSGVGPGQLFVGNLLQNAGGMGYGFGGGRPHTAAAAAAAAAHAAAAQHQQLHQHLAAAAAQAHPYPPSAIGSVLLVSNLNEELITPDGLFTLFGVYGDVTRVKILFNKKDSALVQMREPSQAQLALTYLDRLRLFEKPIRVTLSKHGCVQMPKEGQPDAGLTKDYSTSPLHRFKKPDSKNYQNIYAPSPTLHLSNIPPTVSDEEITQAFKTAGFSIKAFKFFPSKDRKMALLQLDSVETAAEALIKMHNFQLRENSHLRVSFSKSTI